MYIYPDSIIDSSTISTHNDMHSTGMYNIHVHIHVHVHDIVHRVHTCTHACSSINIQCTCIYITFPPV